MHQEASPKLTVINHVSHGGASHAAPNCQHPLPRRLTIADENQYVMHVARLVHNHPSGDPTPSRADIDMTKTIITAAKPLGIAVQDHLIIGKSGFASMKGLLLI